MFGPSPTFPGGPGGFPAGAGGGSSGFSGRDIVWVDLRFPAGGSGNESTPLNTANLGLGAVPDGGTLVMVGGDASTEPGVSIGARSFSARGLGGQMASGGLPPKLPTLTYAITTGTQRLAFHNVSVALVHAGASASLTQFHFEFCPTVTLTAGTDAPPVYWVGDGTCTFSGAGGAAQFLGGTIDGYTANSGAIVASGCAITGNLESPTSVTLLGGCTFGAISVTAPSISIDPASYYRAVAAGVSFSSAVTLLVATAAPVDIGTANAAGTAKTLALSDHVHDLPFTPVQDALGAATGSISVNNQKITNLAAPTSGGDAVTKTYADALASGLKVKTPAVAVATANQATMSGQAQTIDGVALNTVGQRVLLTAQTTATQNGLWVIAAGAWTRPTDFAVGSSAAQSYVLITGGTTGAGSSYFCTNTVGSDVVDTNNLTWVLFSQSASVTAGAGLTKTGNTLDVVAGDATLVVSADSMVVGVIGNANLANNTIALARLANAGAQNDFLMRKSASGGAWEDGTAAEARTALGIFAYGALFPVRAATTANITLSGAQTIDGVSLIAGDRCLVKDQSTGSQNGPYVVASGAWTRATDADGAGELVGGMIFPISEGTTNGNRVAMLTTNDPITIGSTALTFAMDRVAALGASAPQDVTDGAAAVGTSTLAAPLDHVHHLGFAAVAALLAIASTAVSVNSQKITNLATPTVSTDAVNKAYVDGVTWLPAFTGDVTKALGGTVLTHSANSVVDTVLRDSTGFSVIGKATTGTGDPGDIVAGTDSVLGRNGSGNLAFGQVQTGMIAADAVTYAKLQNVSATNRFLGRITAAAGDAEELTGTQATTLLDTFTSSLKGLVSASGGGTANYARADGTWATPPGVPGGSTTQIQYNNGGAFDGASGITIVGSETAFGYGSGTLPSTGIHRYGYVSVAGGGVVIAAIRREGDATSANLVRWNGGGAANSLEWGGTPAAVETIANFRVNATLFTLYTSDTIEWEFSATQLDAKGNNIIGWGQLNQTTSGGATPISTIGSINLANSSNIARRNAANTADLNALVMGDTLQIGDVSNGTGNTYDVAPVQTHTFRIGGTTEMTLSNSQLDVANNNIVQTNVSNASSTVFMIRAAGSTASNNSGGTTMVTGGTRAGSGNYGGAQLALNPDDGGAIGYQPMVEVAHLANARRVVALCMLAAITTTQLPTNAGDGVTYFGNAATAPTAAPVSGALVYSESAQLKGLGNGLCFTDLTPANGGTATGTLRAVRHRENRVQTTNVTQTVLDTFTLPNGCVALVEARVAGRRSTTDRGGWFLRATISQEAGTAGIVSTVDKLEQASDGQWDATFTVSGGAVRVSVTGLAATTIEWWTEWKISIYQA